MQLPRIPLFLSVTILTVAGTAVTLFVHAQSGTKAFTGKAALQPEDVGGSIESDTPITRKTIRLENTGSGSDIFRTSLAPNPEGRCGLRLAGEPAPSSNTLPNPYPATRDTSIAVGPGNAVYLTVACVTGGLSPGSFTWGFKTVSLGAVEANVSSVIAEAQDTVQVTAPVPCTDSDGMNYSTKGIATGTYSGARTGYIAIYGQEPDPLTPKATTEKFSTFIDHCSWDPRYLNEGFCDGLGKLSAMGTQCPNGCKDGVCVASPASSSSSAASTSSAVSSSVTCTLALTGNTSTYTVGEWVWYTYTCSAPSDITVQYVQPDGTALKHVQVVGGALTKTMGFGTTNWPTGNYTLRICRNDPACQTPSIVGTLSFTLSSASPSTTSPLPAIPATGMDPYNTCLWRECPPPGPTTSTCVATCVREQTFPVPVPSSPVAPSTLVTPTPSPSTAVPIPHPAPSPNQPRVQTGSSATQKKVSKARVQAFKKQQQALRRELRSIERSLLRKKNVAALSQIADLRDELADLDLRDPSAADTLRSLQEEIADLRNAVTTKVKRGR